MVLMLPIKDVNKTLQTWKQQGKYEKAKRLEELVRQYGPYASYTVVIDPFPKPEKYKILQW